MDAILLAWGIGVVTGMLAGVYGTVLYAKLKVAQMENE